MRKVLCITSAGPVPDFGFLNSNGFAVTYVADSSPDLEVALYAHEIVVLACETRGTQYARIWWYERALFRHVREGGRLLFCSPGISIWATFWSVYPALLPVTPFHRSGMAENYSTHFRWDRDWEKPHRQRVLPSDHPVCSGITEWPEFYEGAKPGSYNSYDFDCWKPKPHSDVALRTEDGSVALAFMNFERGRTGFLLADIHDDAGKAWSAWSNREKFWLALLRHLDNDAAPVERAPAGIEPFAPRLPLVPRQRFEFRDGPAVGRADWACILARTDWTLLSDNQVSVNPSLTPLARDPSAFGDGWYRMAREELGIGHVKFYPLPVQFESALSADAITGGEIVDLRLVEGSYIWRPHLATARFQSADGAIVVEKRMAVGEDTVCAELCIVRGTVEAFRLRGYNRYYGFLEQVGDALVGQLETGVVFGLTASEPVHWNSREASLRYEGCASLNGKSTLSLIFTAALERRDVETRLAAAQADSEHVFAAAFAAWDSYFTKQVPAFRSDDSMVERIIYGAFAGFRLNLYDIPYEPWSDPHSCPSKMHFDQQWEQDDVQVAAIGKWLRDTSLIARQLLRPFKIGIMLNANATFGPPERSTTGLIGELQQYSVPLRDLYLFTRAPALRRDILDALLREERENDEHTPVDPATGLLGTFSCLGMDDSPRWDMVSPGKKAEWFQSFERPMLTTEVNATAGHRAAFLAELLGEEGDPRAEVFHTLAARRKASLREHLWSEAAGFFVDRVAGDTAFSDVLTPMGFVPLLLGSYGEEVDSRVGEPLHDPAVFRTPYGLPTVACSHPKFDANSYWRGSIWSRTNWYAVEALHAAGLKVDAAELTHRWLDLVVENGADLRENFNPVTGEAKCVEMFTEGLSGLADVYLKNVVGFRPTYEGFNFDPFALDSQTPSFSFGPFPYRSHEIAVTWNRATASGALHVDGGITSWSPGVTLHFIL